MIRITNCESQKNPTCPYCAFACNGRFTRTGEIIHCRCGNVYMVQVHYRGRNEAHFTTECRHPDHKWKDYRGTRGFARGSAWRCIRCNIHSSEDPIKLKNINHAYRNITTPGRQNHPYVG